MNLRDRMHGCLLGGACGDALGAPVEFMGMAEITARFGQGGITEFAPAYDGLGLVTDDTQMTLFTVEGLIRAAIRSALRGICSVPAVVNHAYRRWLVTQDQSYETLDQSKELDGWLIRERRLWARRAPGSTCLAALRTSRDSDLHASNDSKGCGTVMRDAPFGLALARRPEAALREAVQAAWTTHGHPSARYASGALAAIIAGLAQGQPLPGAVASACKMVSSLPEAREVAEALRRAVDLAALPDWRGRLPELGEGWVAEEALAIAVLCSLAAAGPAEAIIAAVNHGGDSDSTGAITGNIVGTLHGAAALPSAWTSQVELRDVIEILADDLCRVFGPDGFSTDDAEQIWERYPGW